MKFQKDDLVTIGSHDGPLAVVLQVAGYNASVVKIDNEGCKIGEPEIHPLGYLCIYSGPSIVAQQKPELTDHDERITQLEAEVATLRQLINKGEPRS